MVMDPLSPHPYTVILSVITLPKGRNERNKCKEMYEIIKLGFNVLMFFTPNQTSYRKIPLGTDAVCLQWPLELIVEASQKRLSAQLRACSIFDGCR